MRIIALLLLLTFFTACNRTKSVENNQPVVEKTENNVAYLESVAMVFEAHGGYDSWQKLKQLSYESGESKTLVELQNRYTRIDSETQTVGFDGEKVWVNPPSENADRQRMRYNLMFYFYAFPFVVGDPGINYEDMEPIALGENTYNAVKISYNDGVGDSPKDNYIILSDPETNRMEWLIYTATFGRSESSDRYSLIRYEGWTNRGGVLLPSSLQWYQYKDGTLGGPRGGARVFENVQVSEEYPSMTYFEMPEGAQITKDPNAPRPTS